MGEVDVKLHASLTSEIEMSGQIHPSVTLLSVKEQSVTTDWASQFGVVM
jgi:hypothetical protein